MLRCEGTVILHDLGDLLQRYGQGFGDPGLGNVQGVHNRACENPGQTRRGAQRDGERFFRPAKEKQKHSQGQDKGKQTVAAEQTHQKGKNHHAGPVGPWMGADGLKAPERADHKARHGCSEEHILPHGKAVENVAGHQQIKEEER